MFDRLAMDMSSVMTTTRPYPAYLRRNKAAAPASSPRAPSTAPAIPIVRAALAAAAASSACDAISDASGSGSGNCTDESGSTGLKVLGEEVTSATTGLPSISPVIRKV
jgi:hypothetical protein